MKHLCALALLTMISSVASAEVVVNIEESYDGGSVTVKGQSEPAEDGSVEVTITVTPEGTVTDVVVNLTDALTCTHIHNLSVSNINGTVDKIYAAPGERVNTEDLLISFILDEEEEK